MHTELPTILKVFETMTFNLVKATLVLFIKFHSYFSWTFLSKEERCMRLSLCEAPTLKEQHKGQPQHRETSRPTIETTIETTIEGYQQCSSLNRVFQ